ncbi:hypothetical protein Droror1_Dr00013702 [Drosera rotundifolia]
MVSIILQTVFAVVTKITVKKITVKASSVVLGGLTLFVMESAWKWAADHIKDEKGDSAKENTEKPTPKTKSKAKTIATISKDSSSATVKCLHCSRPVSVSFSSVA